MINYKLGNNDIHQNISCIIKISDESKTFIPINEENTDYQEYLAWLAEGNEPLPADDPS